MPSAADLRVLGHHVIAEYQGCDRALLDDPEGLGDLLVAAARRAGATPLKREFHHFSPYGVSGGVIIAESHLTIHTWPEHLYAAVDFFTCGERVDPLCAHAYLGESLRATFTHHVTLERGTRCPPKLSRPTPGIAAKRRATKQGDSRMALRSRSVRRARRRAFTLGWSRLALRSPRRRSVACRRPDRPEGLAAALPGFRDNGARLLHPAHCPYAVRRGP